MNILIILSSILILISFVTIDSFAHQDGCHRWHSCPSDSGSYTCGDKGYCSECYNNMFCQNGQFVFKKNSVESKTELENNLEKIMPDMTKIEYGWESTKFRNQKFFDKPEFEIYGIEGEVSRGFQFLNNFRTVVIIIKFTSTEYVDEFYSKLTESKKNVKDASYFSSSYSQDNNCLGEMMPIDSNVKSSYVCKYQQYLFLQVSVDTAEKIFHEKVSNDFRELFFNNFELYETEYKIPSWVKTSMKWYSEDIIEEQDMLNLLKFLIKERIVKIPPTESNSNFNTEIPSWVKNNIKWWSESVIDDDYFIQGIQFLIKEEILKIES